MKADSKLSQPFLACKFFRSSYIIHKKEAEHHRTASYYFDPKLIS